jgi:hypothetical protein
MRVVCVHPGIVLVGLCAGHVDRVGVLELVLLQCGSRWCIGACVIVIGALRRCIGGSALVTGDHRPSTIDHRPSTTDHRPPTFMYLNQQLAINNPVLNFCK